MLHLTRVVPLALLLLAHGTLPAEDKTPAEGASLLARAADTVNIQAAGSQSFRMKAVLQLAISGRSVKADYQLVWASEKQWREEMSSSGYVQLRGTGQNKYWDKRNLGFVPLALMQAYGTLGFALRLGARPGEEVMKVRQQKVDGEKLDCVQVDGGLSVRKELCIDPKTSFVLQMQESHPNLTYKFTDYAPFGNKSYPRTLRAFEDGKLVLEARVQELVPEPAPPPAQFAPPQGAREYPPCDRVRLTSGKLLTHVMPLYPELAKMNRQQGKVTLYALIQPDGTIGDLAVVRSAGELFDRAALDAVRSWRYQPYLCDGTPVPVETLIDVNFTLQSF